MVLYGFTNGAIFCDPITLFSNKVLYADETSCMQSKQIILLCKKAYREGFERFEQMIQL